MMHKPSFTRVFQAVADRHGGRLAILHDGRPALTYSELNVSALALAARLNKLGAGREAVVGLCIDKSAEYIASLLGTWYTGAAFLPLDPRLPGERLALMVKESAMTIAVVQAGYEDLFAGLSVQIVPPPHSLPLSADQLDATSPAREDDLAYTIFTSGSTGRPKGVMVTHRGIVNFIQAQIEAFQLKAGSRALFYLSTSFDASISDIGTALLSGATLCIEKPELLQPGSTFAELIRERQITHMDIPPALLRLMKPDDMPACLETIIIGGEVCPPEVVRSWAKRLRVVNVYGPTESTVCTSLCLCDPESWTGPLIGSPLPGVTYHLLDEELHAVQPGTPAELYIGGIGLARGYLNRPDLTSSKFIIRNGERLYRTGDLVVACDKGEIQFLGRIDRQVKVRGLLIEPEEIETRLLGHPAIQSVAVLKRELKHRSGRQILVAFIVPKPGYSLSARLLREHLALSLPRWMLPQRYEFLDCIPLTVTGKVDVSALRDRELSATRVSPGAGKQLEFSAVPLHEPRAAEAQLLAEVWQQVLGLESVAIDEDFFELGGDSFGVLEACAAAEARGLTVPPTLLISHPTIGGIVRALKAMQNKRDFALSASGAMSCAELRADIKSDEQWQELLKAARGRPGEIPASPQSVLLTGATGFLGARLLAELLDRTSARIYCLVRTEDSSSGMERISAAFARHGTTLDNANRQRVIPICGRLEQSRFGLSRDEWSQLSETIDTIYHCAAHVNMLLPYSDLRPTNVQGTVEIARFLCDGRKKSLHYASTLSVFVATDCNTGVLLEADELDRTGLVYGGYAQTKWAAEVLLRSLSGAAGPISYYRFGLITGDSGSGRSSPTDFLSMFMRGIAALGCVPEATSDLSVDVTPVDFAAAALAHLSMEGVGRRSSSTFHIANPKSLPLSQLIASMRRAGIEIAEVSSRDFLDRLTNHSTKSTDAAESAACLALCRCLSDSGCFDGLRTMDLFQATDVKFDMRNTLAGLSGSGLSCPPASDELIQTYVRQILKETAGPWSKSQSRAAPRPII